MKTIAPFIKLSLSTLAIAISVPTHADTIFGIYAGAGTWQTQYSGEAGNPATTTDDLGIQDKNNSFYYIAIEHPVPVLPNIKLQHANITSRQTAIISRSFSIGNQTFSASDNVTTDFDLSYTDAVLYYEILDNWLNADVGINVRNFSGYLKAESSTQNENTDVNVTIPMLYAKVQFDLPLTGFFAGVEANYISYSGDKVSDLSAKVGYSFDSVVDAGVELGIRQLNVTINEDDVNADLKLSGPYLAAVFHF